MFCEQAFCEEGNIEDNGILAFAKFVIFSVLELRHQTGKLSYRFMFEWLVAARCSKLCSLGCHVSKLCVAIPGLSLTPVFLRGEM